MCPSAFIIHGRDLAARDAVVTFLTSLGLQHLSFESVAARLGPAPFVADVVLAGIRDAAVVIALFTPEEQAAFYDPATASYLGGHSGEARWQARPNVIFEAGVALGLAREKTILITLGSDVQLFSDVAGVHFISLAEPRATQILSERIWRIVGALNLKPPPIDDTDFSQVVRYRWRHFDELDDLEKQLANCYVGEDVNLIAIVAKVVSEVKRDWRRSTPEQFMLSVKKLFTAGEIAENAYWWLVVHGFFRFRDIETWFSGTDPAWKQSVEFVVFSERGLALIEKLRVVGTTA